MFEKIYEALFGAPTVRSDFDPTERISFDNVPKIFASVRDKSIKRIRKYSSKSINAKLKGKFEPGALTANLETIDGNFESAYARLEGDYYARLTNLQNAYQDGLAQIQARILELESKMNDYDFHFEKFADVSKRVTGHEIRPDLRYSAKKFEEIRTRYQKVKEQKV